MWFLQVDVVFHRAVCVVLDICDISEKHQVQRLAIMWLRYLLLMLLKHDFQLSYLRSRVISGNEFFWKCRWPLAEGKQARELDSYHFSFSLPCYLSPHPCRACWQELINLFMGWTELAPIIQGVELLSGGNKRLYPLPICPPVTLCPVFWIPWSHVPFVLVIVVYSYETTTTYIPLETFLLAKCLI